MYVIILAGLFRSWDLISWVGRDSQNHLIESPFQSMLEIPAKAFPADDHWVCLNISNERESVTIQCSLFHCSAVPKYQNVPLNVHLKSLFLSFKSIDLGPTLWRSSSVLIKLFFGHSSLFVLFVHLRQGGSRQNTRFFLWGGLVCLS